MRSVLSASRLKAIQQSPRGGRAFAVAYFQFVAVRIFEKNGVITGAVFQTELGAFDIFSACFADHFRDLVHGFAARRPEGDSISIWPMVRLFVECKKVQRYASLGFKQSPLLSALVDAKAYGRQDLRIEPLCVFAVLHPKIDVIEKAGAHVLSVHAGVNLSTAANPCFAL